METEVAELQNPPAYFDGKVLWDKEVADPAAGYSITHAPLIIGDNVIVGVSGGEYGIRGHVTAYNAMTGDQVWRWPLRRWAPIPGG